jgi:hypothetical protein
MIKGRKMLVDPHAKSADPKLPAFLAIPAGALAYHGFPSVPETATDGWTFGAITEFVDPNGCDAGDGFVIAPDGSRAGIVWGVGTGSTEEIMPPEPGRWGVYAVWFPSPITSVDDLVAAFHGVLPELKAIYSRVCGNAV